MSRLAGRDDMELHQWGQQEPRAPWQGGTTEFSAIREHSNMGALDRRDSSVEIPEELNQNPRDILRPHWMCQSTGNRHRSYGDECVL